MAWTEDRVIVLKKLWAAGHSASQIARTLGGVTRNAVIGKVYRLGLSNRTAPVRPFQAAAHAESAGGAAVSKAAPPKAASVLKKSARSALPEKSSVKSVLVSDETIAQGTASIFSLRENMCKWPIGDPSDPDFRFCGRRSVMGPYCAEHAKLAFQPNRRREQKKESA